MQKTVEKVIIGIDVSKEKLDIWDSFESKHYVIKNDKRSIGNWFKPRRKKYSTISILLEPTGGYEKVLIEQCLSYGLQVNKVHPNHFHYYKKALGQDAKTDKLDCHMLSDYMGEAHKRVKVVDESYKDGNYLKELHARRVQIKEQIHAERCRLGHVYSNKVVCHSIKSMLKILEKELALLDTAIENALHENEKMREKLKLLQTFKGVGRVTSQTLCAALPELGDLSKGEIARLVGVAPINKDSGEKKGHRHIHGGRGDVRKVLYMAAQVAVRFNQEMKTYFDNLRARGKEYKVALVAVMRKLICILNSMVRDETPYISKTERMTLSGVIAVK